MSELFAKNIDEQTTNEKSSKLLNVIFEDIYMLMDAILDNPKHLDNTSNKKYSYFSSAIETFTSNIKTKELWIDEDDYDKNDEDYEDKDENEDNKYKNRPYFESGYHETTGVYYPFDNNEELEKNDIINKTHSWTLLLDSIFLDIDDDEFISQAKELKERLFKFID